MKQLFSFAIVFSMLVLGACKKQTEDFSTATIEDYAPLAVGKFITYQLDSFKYLPFSLKDTTVTYQVKHVVDAMIDDNLGRPAYRLIRYIRKNDQDGWTPDNTFVTL